MKKKIAVILLLFVMLMQLAACGTPVCKQSDCDETNLYKDGYCQYHYYLKTGDETLKDVINGLGDMFK